MHTDDLTTAMSTAVRDQPFLPDTAGTWQRGQSRRRRRRAASAGSAITVTAVAVIAGGLFTSQDRLTPQDRGTAGQFAAGGGTASAAFTVERNTSADNDVPCVLDVVLPAGSRPGRLTLPCGSSATDAAARALVPAMIRQDLAAIDGGRVLLTSGTAPAGAVSVTAQDEDGRTLTGELRTVNFSTDRVFVLFSRGDSVKGLRYVMADGRVSPAQDVSTP